MIFGNTITNSFCFYGLKDVMVFKSKREVIYKGLFL